MTRKRNTENDLSISAGATASVPARRKPVARPRANRAAAAAPAAEPAIAPETAVALPETAPATEYAPTREEIALQAYLYWEERGCQGGCPEEDWLRAEQELRERAAAAIA